MFSSWYVRFLVVCMLVTIGSMASMCLEWLEPTISHFQMVWVYFIFSFIVCCQSVLSHGRLFVDSIDIVNSKSLMFLGYV